MVLRHGAPSTGAFPVQPRAIQPVGQSLADQRAVHSALQAHGCSRYPSRAKQFYAVIVAGTLVGVGMDYLGINPIDALFFTAVINGFVAPPLLVMIMLVGNNKKIMGRRTNSRLTNVLGRGAAAVMFLAAGVLVVTSL
jgi:Mn2+/Fe2+ NRAMP family transporter